MPHEVADLIQTRINLFSRFPGLSVLTLDNRHRLYVFEEAKDLNFALCGFEIHGPQVVSYTLLS